MTLACAKFNVKKKENFEIKHPKEKNPKKQQQKQTKKYEEK
jgi:hypothetical protein